MNAVRTRPSPARIGRADLAERPNRRLGIANLGEVNLATGVVADVDGAGPVSAQARPPYACDVRFWVPATTGVDRSHLIARSW